MKHLIWLSDFGEKGIYEVFRLADELRAGKHREALHGKTSGFLNGWRHPVPALWSMP